MVLRSTTYSRFVGDMESHIPSNPQRQSKMAKESLKCSSWRHRSREGWSADSEIMATRQNHSDIPRNWRTRSSSWYHLQWTSLQARHQQIGTADSRTFFRPGWMSGTCPEGEVNNMITSLISTLRLSRGGSACGRLFLNVLLIILFICISSPSLPTKFCFIPLLFKLVIIYSRYAHFLRLFLVRREPLSGWVVKG